MHLYIYIYMEITDQQIFEQNKKVYTSLAGYNTAYTNYKSCIDISSNDGCANLSTQLDNSYNELHTNIDFLYSLLSSSPNGDNINDSNMIKDVHDSNNKLRIDLASQLQNIYKQKLSVEDERNINNGLNSMHNMDSTLYTGLVWTTLVTICLYYIFVKL
jgi:hypothetical protein